MPFYTCRVGSVDWTPESAEKTAAVMCTAAGLHFDHLVLLRFGQNALFRVEGLPYVLRVARPATGEIRVRTEMLIARALERAGFPAIRLARLPVEQPLRHDSSLGTFWYWIDGEPGTAAPLGQFGHALRRFHNVTASLADNLPSWDPFCRLQSRLAGLEQTASQAELRLLRSLYEQLQEELTSVRYELPAGVLHGDAHRGNTLLHDGQLVFLDFEEACVGPREWDLVPTAVSVKRMGLSPAQYQDFSEAYGFDVMRWAGFRVLRRLRELDMTAWLMQNRATSPEVAREVEVRLRSWREDDEHARWRAF